MPDVLQQCANGGFTMDQIEQCLDRYEELNVWQMNQGRSRLTFV